MGTPGYENGFEFRLLPDRIDTPRRVKRPTTFFVNSMSDLFHEDMSAEYLDRVFETIRATPHHTYQILTKRENNMASYFSSRTVPSNAWLGVTVENKREKRRIERLQAIDANVRFLSVEPLLSDLGVIDLRGIHWVIVGGESGPGARPMKKEWALHVQRQCDDQGVAFFFKQWGTWGADGVRRSKKANGRLLDGKEWNADPMKQSA